jgi:hypothetical protein
MIDGSERAERTISAETASTASRSTWLSPKDSTCFFTLGDENTDARPCNRRGTKALKSECLMIAIALEWYGTKALKIEWVIANAR